MKKYIHMVCSSYAQQMKFSARAVGILVLTSLLSIILHGFGIGKENILLVFMVGVLVTAAFTYGYFYGVVAAVSSVMIFNYFFTMPVHTFLISNTNDVVLLMFFLMVAMISSTLTVRFQKQLAIAQKNEQTVRLLYEMSRGFVNVTGKENIIQLGIRCIYEHTHYESSVELSDETVVKSGGQPYTSADYMMMPIIGLTKQIGVLKIYNHNRGLSVEEELLIKTSASQMGIALDRELVYREQERIKIEMEREHMRSSMLRSISHDFRTPLTGIIGDCSLILEMEELEAEPVCQLAGEINEQAVWLMKMMENILNMTKLEKGQMEIRMQEEVVEDIIYDAASHVNGLRTKRQFTALIPQDMLVARMDGALMVQVVTNLLDNSMKHTKEGGSIAAKTFYRNGRVYVQIEDDGDGISQDMLPHVFDEFVTASKERADHKRGIGLGLAICKSVVEAHGGEIWAENRPEGGARFTFWLKAKKVGTDGR